ncbi:hypothetical protein HY041_04020 [Candidatus Roizmanbacteria bacterium]|nr:hypothetical protein [Candidatus Roizmanbacteria bacterium]
MESFRMRYVVPAMLFGSIALMGCSSQASSGADARGTPIAPIVPVTSSSSMNPCNEAFKALQEAFRRVTPDRVTDSSVDVWPADRSGKSTHPRIPKWQGKTDVSWREVTSFMRFNCEDEFEIKSFATDKDERFYDEGVIVKRKLVQEFSLPRVDLTRVRNTIMTITALLGLGALGGLGMKKALA